VKISVSSRKLSRILNAMDWVWQKRNRKSSKKSRLVRHYIRIHGISFTTNTPTELADLCIEFQKNLIEDTTALPFTKEELEGLPQDFFEGLKHEAGKYHVSLKYPEMFPVLQKAKRAETRRLMDIAREGQCQAVNVPLFEQVLQLRQREAELLGFESHAHFILAIRMAKTPEQVMTFLNELKAKLEQPLAEEIARLLDLKRAECKSRGEQCDEELHSWDWRYYQNLLLEQEYTVDDEVIKEYFPLEHVTQGLLDIYQSLLGLVFKPTQHAHVWHSDVTQYDVLDATTKQFMGHFYLDLFPRDGKYTHAAEFDLMKHCVYGNGEEQFPAAAMVANFTKPQSDKPSLLKVRFNCWLI
jgi:thimet oligopeptidase